MTRFDAEGFQALHELVAERPPAHVRLDAVHQDHVPGQPGQRRGPVGRVLGLCPGQRDPGRRPDQAFGLAALDLDHRPVDLEVVEVLGVDGGDRGRLPGDAQVVDHPAGRLTGVVPALEPSDRNRRGEFADVVELDDSPPPTSRWPPGNLRPGAVPASRPSYRLRGCPYSLGDLLACSPPRMGADEHTAGRLGGASRGGGRGPWASCSRQRRRSCIPSSPPTRSSCPTRGEILLGMSDVAVLFDMDGLLIDSEPLWFAAEAAVMARLGAQWTQADQQQLLGGSLERSVSYMLAKAARPVPPQTLAAWLMADITERVRRDVPLRPGAPRAARLGRPRPACPAPWSPRPSGRSWMPSWPAPACGSTCWYAPTT